MHAKRTIKEVCAIHEMEPTLKDLFVEGSTDESFIKWYIGNSGAGSVSVYPIDLIDVPDEIVLKHGLTAGSNRSRVLAVACELAEQRPQGLSVLCLADRDFEDYCPSVRDNAYILFTDCNSLDLYAFTLHTMRKFAAVALGGLPMPAETLMDMLIATLRQIYTLRLANELLGWGMRWISFTRYISFQQGALTFRKEELIRTYLQNNTRWADRGIFENKVQEAERLLDQDPRRTIRGHDFGDLFLWLIRKLRSDRKYGNRETLEGSLMASVERCDLENAPFFRRLQTLATA